MAALSFRQDYFSDPTCYAGLVGLLRDTFDIDISIQDRFGGPNPSAMPFGYFDAAGRCVANFSAFSMPLVIDGRQVHAVGYQSGAVRPEYRGQGLYRDLMRRAFVWARQKRYDMDLLLTDKPDLYSGYGFQAVPQHLFRGKVAHASQQERPGRLLSLDCADDLLILRRLLGESLPVSEIFSVASRDYFLLNASFDAEIRLSYLPDHDCIVAWRRDGDRLCVLDVLARRFRPLGDLVSALGAGDGEIDVCFPPDRLDWPQGKPMVCDGPCALMIKSLGAWPQVPSMLSPLADF